MDRWIRSASMDDICGNWCFDIPLVFSSLSLHDVGIVWCALGNCMKNTFDFMKAKNNRL